MRRIAGIDPGWGLTALRIAMGLIFVVAGWKKLAGGFAAVAALFAKLGIPIPGVTGPFIAILELVGGLALLAGVATRWFGLLFALEFLVAAFYVKLPGSGWDASRIDLMLLAGAICLVLAGPGRAAVDAGWLERV